MFLATRPSSRTIERFLQESQDLPLSYDIVGLDRPCPPGFDVDDDVVVIGKGRTTFEKAERALHAWKHFDLGWLEVFPKQGRVETGTVVAVLMRHLGFWSLNGCRVVYAVGDEVSETRRGFAYGTLPNHAERGEELFEVCWDPESDQVTYRIKAISKPRALLARVGKPIVRVLQKKCRHASAEALRAAINEMG